MVVDASVWISAFITGEVNHERSEAWRQMWLRVPLPLVLPTLALAEIGGGLSRRTGSSFVADGLVSSLLAYPEIEFRDLDHRLGRRAARHATRLKLRGADAVYVALAADLGVPLVTWDQEVLTRAASVIDVRTPDQVPIESRERDDDSSRSHRPGESS